MLFMTAPAGATTTYVFGTNCTAQCLKLNSSGTTYRIYGMNTRMTLSSLCCPLLLFLYLLLCVSFMCCVSTEFRVPAAITNTPTALHTGPKSITISWTAPPGYCFYLCLCLCVFSWLCFCLRAVVFVFLFVFRDPVLQSIRVHTLLLDTQSQ